MAPEQIGISCWNPSLKGLRSSRQTWHLEIRYHPVPKKRSFSSSSHSSNFLKKVQSCCWFSSPYGFVKGKIDAGKLWFFLFDEGFLWFSITGWWFGTWILWLSIYIYCIYWECHNPNWLSLHHFSEGWRKTTNQINFPTNLFTISPSKTWLPSGQGFSRSSSGTTFSPSRASPPSSRWDARCEISHGWTVGWSIFYKNTERGVVSATVRHNIQWFNPLKMVIFHSTNSFWLWLTVRHGKINPCY